MAAPLTESALKALIANLGRYLANLARAGSRRKHESRKALQDVILATRQTRIYLRALKDGKGKNSKGANKKGKQTAAGAAAKIGKQTKKPAGKARRDYAKEEQLTTLWTRLSFELQALGVTKLAKRCDIAARYWTDPDNFSLDFLTRARARLEDLEREARVLLKKTA